MSELNRKVFHTHSTIDHCLKKSYILKLDSGVIMTRARYIFNSLTARTVNEEK